MTKKLLFILIMTISSLQSKGQLVVVDTLSVPDLVSTLVGVGIQVSNITWQGDSLQFAQFDGSNSNIGINKGIILSTGEATSARDLSRPYNMQNTAFDQSNAIFTSTPDHDNDLTAISGQNTNDAAVIEFDIRPAGDTLKFNYVFSSEEYAQFVCTGFNDVFGFFISGPGITGPYSSPSGFPGGSVNIALLPDLVTPVAINNVNNGNIGGSCSPVNAQYYLDNGDGIDPNFLNNNNTSHTFNGTTVKLVAKIPVTVCALYHLKLAIADVSDESLNSGVFLESGSFTSKQINLSTAYANVYEGCKDGKIQFQRKDTNNTDSITVYLEYGGDAIEGVDYPTLPDSLVMGPGSGIYNLVIPSFSDGNVEPGETIIIYIVQNDCFNGRLVIDSIMITLYDELQMDAGNDTTIYYGESVQINAYNPDAEFYAWTPNYAIDDTTLYNPTVNPCSTTTYTVHASDTLGCLGEDSVVVNVVQRHPFDLSKLNAYESCDDGYVAFTRNESDRFNESLTYYLSYGGTATSILDYDPLITDFTLPAFDSAAIINIHAIEDGIYDPNETITVILYDSNACFTNKYPIDTVVVVIKDLRIIASGDTSLCKGDSIQIFASGGGSFDWDVDTSIISDTSSNNPYVYPDSTIKFIVRSGNDNCYKPDSLIITVNEFKANFEDSITVCMRDTVQIGEASVAGYIYSWSPTTGINNSNSSNPDLWLNSAQSVEYVVTINDTNLCVDLDTIHVDVLQAPDSVEIFGALSVCPDVTGIDYWTNDSTITTFSWFVSGGSIVSGQSSDSIIVDWGGANNNANVKLVPINNLGCLGDTSKFDVIINQILQTETPNGPDTLCLFDIDSLNYFISPVNGSSYTWNVNIGTINLGQGTNNVDISWTGTNGAYVFIQEQSNTSSTVCFGQSDTLFVGFNSSPDTTLNIFGDSSLCAFEDSILYQLNGYSNSIYSWSLDTGGAIIGNLSNDSVWINWDSTGVYQLTVTETTDKGCVGKLKTHTIEIHPLPNTSFVSGDVTVCNSHIDSLAYSISGLDNSTYYWNSTVGYNVINGTGDSVLISWDSINNTKEIKVLEVSEFGCVSDTLYVPIIYDASGITLNYITDNFENEEMIDLFWSSSYSLDSLSNNLKLYRRQLSPSVSEWIKIGDISKHEQHYQDGPLTTNEEEYQYYLSTANLCFDSISTSLHNNIVLKSEKSEDEYLITLSWSLYNDWKKFGGISYYNLFRKIEDGDYELYSTLDASDTTAVLLNDRKGFEYCYRIEAVQQNNEYSSWSNESCIGFDYPVMVYNALTPNGDDKNETFIIDNIDLYPDNKVEIFNRWGNLVYSANSYNNDWNGGNLPDGTYYYVVEILVKGNDQKSRGTLLLQR